MKGWKTLEESRNQLFAAITYLATFALKGSCSQQGDY